MTEPLALFLTGLVIWILAITAIILDQTEKRDDSRYYYSKKKGHYAYRRPWRVVTIAIIVVIVFLWILAAWKAVGNA